MTSHPVFGVRFHGRGGQGVVTTAELLSVAAFREGRHAQAFPTFGSERTGAPVAAFCRISGRPIRSHEPIVRPDAVVIQDSTLLHQVDVFAGLPAEGYVLVNTVRTLEELGLGDLVRRLGIKRMMTVPATDLGRTHLGRPLPGAALLGALAALTGVIALSGIELAIRERFAAAVADGNVAAASAGHALVRAALEEPSHA